MTAWTDHVRDKAKEYGLSYKAAMSDDRVKGSYTKAPRKKATKPQAPSEPPKTAKERRTMAASRAMELIHKRTADGKESWHDAASKYIQESADAGSRFMKEKKPRKPMSEETKAMLKARREAKKADVAKKFESFWERHEGLPAGGPLAGSGVRTASLATIAKEAATAAVEGVLKSVPQPVVVAPKKKRAKPGQGKGRGVQKMSEETKALLKARRQGSKMRPPKQPTTFTALSADEMAFHANLLG
jgi:hypothetical protein